MTEEFTTADLIDELQAYVNDERAPGGVTAKEWANVKGVAVTTASNELLDLMVRGVLTRRKYRVNGHRQFVYYKATPEALASQ